MKNEEKGKPRPRDQVGIGNAFLGKVPPHSSEAEVGVLGGVLLKNEILDVVAELVRPQDFYSEANGLIFQAFLELSDHKTPIDLTTASQLLKYRGELEAVGGLAYLSSLLDATPTSANFKTWAKIVQDNARVRAVIGVALDLLEQGYGDFGDVEQYVTQAEVLVLEATRARGTGNDAVPLGREVIGLFDELVRLRNDPDLADEEAADLGVLTGIAGLDHVLGGLQRGEVTVIAGPSSMGKTALALQFADHCRSPSALHSLEMPRKQLGYRQLAAETGIPIAALRRPRSWSNDTLRKIADGARRAQDRSVIVDDRAGLNPTQIRTSIRRLRAEHEIDMAIIDFLGLVEGNPTHGRQQQSREREIAVAMNEFKAGAKECGIPYVVLCQINRQYLSRKDPRPKYEDLRESGAIGHVADTVIFPWRPEALKPARDRVTNEAGLEAGEIIVAKNRNGSVGDVPIWWDGARMRFKARALESEEAMAEEDPDLQFPPDETPSMFDGLPVDEES